MTAPRRALLLIVPALALAAAAGFRPAPEVTVEPPAPLPAVVSQPRAPAQAVPDFEVAARALVRLRAAALAGDASAAWQAFQMTELCETPERNRSALRELPLAMFATLRVTLEPEAQLDARLCEGVALPQLREHRAYLRIAADGGIRGAAADFFDLGPADEEASAWGEHALALLKRDAAHGEIGALAALQTVYQYGGIAAINATQALTYQLALQEIMAADAQEYAPAELELQRDAADRMASQLPLDQRLAAEAGAAELVARVR
jgi:hypothetical protein